MNTPLEARRAVIVAAIAAMPAKINPHRARLDFVTRAFLEAPLFTDAVMHGWSDAELFAVDPARCAARPDRAGIVSGIALSALAVPKLIRIEARKAVIECGTGNRSLLTHRRTGRTDQLGIVWWQSPELGATEPYSSGDSRMSTNLCIEPVGKTCTCCRRDRPINRFPHSKFTADGRTDKCLDCISAGAQQWRLGRDSRRPRPRVAKSSKRNRSSKGAITNQIQGSRP